MFDVGSLLPRCRAVSVALLLAMVSVACSDDDPCLDDVDALARCDRMFRDEVCDDDEGRCMAHCYGELTCREFSDLDRGRWTPRLERCLTSCDQGLRCKDGQRVPASYACDGAADCTDGSDEVGCRYHTCQSGQLVRETAFCDGYEQCVDGSDEASCQ